MPCEGCKWVEVFLKADSRPLAGFELKQGPVNYFKLNEDLSVTALPQRITLEHHSDGYITHWDCTCHVVALQNLP